MKSRRPTTTALLCRSAIFGAAIGARSSLVLAGPVLTRGLAAVTGAGTGAQTEGPSTGVTVTAAAALGGELVGDKLPMTPSRLETMALAVRIGAAVIGGVVLARRERSSVALPVVAAVVGAVAEVTAGVRWRGFTSSRGVAVQGALVEDAFALGMAAYSCWPRRSDQLTPARRS